MIEFLDLMYKPFLACLILTGIHAYIGYHVIERGVIFVDLALAQIAAFGATVAFLIGFSLHSNQSYFCSLLFTLLGAILLAFTRQKKQIVPQEALIGMVYVVAAASAIIILSFAPEGGEELKTLLVGHLLFVDSFEIAKIAVLYSLVGIIHYIFRKQFFLISGNPKQAETSGLNIRFWDFLFYATFGVIVTSSVEMAGVLLVFSFLMAPSLCAMYLAKNLRARLGIAWGFGLLASCLGMFASYFLDLPTGAAVVCVFGLLLLLVLLYKVLLAR